jgi:methionine synthase II (cobalamin-independent)
MLAATAGGASEPSDTLLAGKAGGTARPAAISFEAANPRHAHEWTLFEQVKLPEGKVIIPGVIESKSNFIEHSELVAQRIARYANLVGRDNVIAGSDCGFGTWVGQGCRRSRRCVGQTGDDGRGREAGHETILGRLRRLSP